MLNYDEYGLTEVPKEKRLLTWWHLSLIWGSISFCLPTFMIGALALPGLGWEDALRVNIIGNAICAVLITLGGYAGTRYGLPAVVIFENFFGAAVGGKILTALIFISTLGWFAVLLAATADGILAVWGLPANGQVIIVVALGLAMTATAALGNRFILQLDRLALPGLLAAMMYLFYRITQLEPNWLQVSYTPSGEITFSAMLNLIIAGYIVGALCSSDFSRYAKDNVAQWIGTFWGAFIVSLLLSILALYSKYVTGQWNPLQAVYISGDSLIPVFVIIFSAWTTNHALLYSTGLALTKLFGKQRPILYTMGAGVIGTGLGLSDITANLENFLTLLGYACPGILGILISHYFLVTLLGSRRIVQYPKTFVVATGLSVIFQAYLPEYLVTTLVGIFSGGASYVVAVLLISSSRAKFYRRRG